MTTATPTEGMGAGLHILPLLIGIGITSDHPRHAGREDVWQSGRHGEERPPPPLNRKAGTTRVYDPP